MSLAKTWSTYFSSCFSLVSPNKCDSLLVIPISPKGRARRGQLIPGRRDVPPRVLARVSVGEAGAWRSSSSTNFLQRSNKRSTNVLPTHGTNPVKDPPLGGAELI